MTLSLLPTWNLLDQRVNWLHMRAKLMTENIASSDVYGAKRKEIRPFHDLVRRNGIQSDGVLKIQPRDIRATAVDANQDMEMLELSRNVLEQDALISLRKNIHKIIRSISSFQAS
jgi:flagellar basal body rod protein FlgB